ncbi:MAG: PIN domain-containing protein [Geminicoccaceae bacterium]
MAGYLLDTNIVSYLIDAQATAHPAVRQRLARLADDDTVSISIITCYELHHWLAFDDTRQASVDALLADLGIEPLTIAGAVAFGRLARILRDQVSAATMRRASIDCMIAATALVSDRILVSNDAVFVTLGEIEPKLRLEDWVS